MNILTSVLVLYLTIGWVIGFVVAAEILNIYYEVNQSFRISKITCAVVGQRENSRLRLALRIGKASTLWLIAINAAFCSIVLWLPLLLTHRR